MKLSAYHHKVKLGQYKITYIFQVIPWPTMRESASKYNHKLNKKSWKFTEVALIYHTIIYF